MRISFSIMAMFLLIGLQLEGAELITNGDFEQTLDVGWHKYQDISPSGTGTIFRSNYDSDANMEARTYIRNGYYNTLYQTVPITSTNISFSATIKLRGSSSALYGHYSTAAFIIYYLNSSDTLLGETRICRFTTNCDWVNTSTVHLIKTSSTDWNDYSFNIQEELSNLSGVNSSDIAKIKVALYSYSTPGC